MSIVFLSLISSDLLNLQKTIKNLDKYCFGYHLDISDFHFVKNLTWGPDFVNQIRKVTKKTLNIHLMVDSPEDYIDLFKLNRKDIISFHLESKISLDIKDLIKKIKDKDLVASIAISPEIDLNLVKDLILKYNLENILLMSVHPGFSGQKFIKNSLLKLEDLNSFRLKNDLNFQIIIDGGVNFENIKNIINYGADKIITASLIFKNRENPLILLKKLNNLIFKLKFSK